MPLVQTSRISWKKRKRKASGRPFLLEKEHRDYQGSQDRPRGRQLYETPQHLCKPRHQTDGKLLFPQQRCNHLGTNCQRRIGRVDQLGFLKGRKESALSTPTDYKSVLVTTSKQSITIPIILYKTENGKTAETTALVDSGATICCIDLHFVRRMKWPLQRLGKPIEARNADRTSNKGGMI